MPTTISYGKHTTPSVKPVPASPAGGAGKKIVEMTGFGEVLRSAMEVFKHNVRYEIGKAILECATWTIHLNGADHAGQNLQPDLDKWVESESGHQGITYMVNVLDEPLNREHGQQKDYATVKGSLQAGYGDLIARITNQRCWQIRETLKTKYFYPGATCTHGIFSFRNGWKVSDDFTFKLTFDALNVTDAGSDKSEALDFWDKDIIEELEYMLDDVTFEMPGAKFDPDAKWIESVAGEKNPEPNRTIYMTQTVGLSIKFHEASLESRASAVRGEAELGSGPVSSVGGQDAIRVAQRFDSILRRSLSPPDPPAKSTNTCSPPSPRTSPCSDRSTSKSHCVRVKSLRVRGELKVDEAEGDDKHDDQNRPDKTEFAFGVKLWVINDRKFGEKDWDMDWKFDVNLDTGGPFDPPLPDWLTEDWLKKVLKTFILEISGEETYHPPDNALFIRFQNREMDMDELMKTIPDIGEIIEDGTGACFKDCITNCTIKSCFTDCWQTACFCATCAACVGTGQPCWDCIADSDCCPKKEPEPES